MKLMLVGSPDAIESVMTLEAAKKRGHEAIGIHLYDLMFEVKDSKFKVIHRDGINILDYDVFIFRGIMSSEPEKSQLYNALILARFLYDNGKRVVDSKLATDRIFPTKVPYTKAKNNIPTPDTVFTLGKNITKHYLKKATYPLIIKSLTGRKGKDIFLVNNYEEAIKAIEEHDDRKFMFQEYIPSRFDVRVFIVGDKILGSMRRDAAEDDFRSNIYQGGQASIYDIDNDPKLREVAMNAMKAANMEIAGVDVMINDGKYYVLEVNRAPQFRGLVEALKIDVAKEIIKYLEETN